MLYPKIVKFPTIEGWVRRKKKSCVPILKKIYQYMHIGSNFRMFNNWKRKNYLSTFRTWWVKEPSTKTWEMIQSVWNMRTIFVDWNKFRNPGFLQIWLGFQNKEGENLWMNLGLKMQWSMVKQNLFLCLIQGRGSSFPLKNEDDYMEY